MTHESALVTAMHARSEMHPPPKGSSTLLSTDGIAAVDKHLWIRVWISGLAGAAEWIVLTAAGGVDVATKVLAPQSARPPGHRWCASSLQRIRECRLKVPSLPCSDESGIRCGPGCTALSGPALEASATESDHCCLGRLHYLPVIPQQAATPV